MILKLLGKSNDAREEADVFLQKNVSSEATCEPGRKIFVVLYGGKNSDALTYLRHMKYMKMNSSATNVKPEFLSPTEQAAMFHIYWVYFQLHEWKNTHAKYFGPKRLRVEIRRCLVGTSYDRSRICPR